MGVSCLWMLLFSVHAHSQKDESECSETEFCWALAKASGMIPFPAYLSVFVSPGAHFPAWRIGGEKTKARHSILNLIQSSKYSRKDHERRKENL